MSDTEQSLRLRAIAAVDWCESELRKHQRLADECEAKNDRWGASLHRAKWNVLEEVIGKFKAVALGGAHVR